MILGARDGVVDIAELGGFVAVALSPVTDLGVTSLLKSFFGPCNSCDSASLLVAFSSFLVLPYIQPKHEAGAVTSERMLFGIWILGHEMFRRMSHTPVANFPKSMSIV